MRQYALTFGFTVHIVALGYQMHVYESRGQSEELERPAQNDS